jgi:electron transfer flavoprotein-quinone oxidoreductase
VDGLIEEGGRIIGLQAGDDRILADVVIAADGVNSLIAQKAGLRSELTPHCVAVGVKELIRLDAATIEARFQVGAGQGAARLFVGCTEGIQGGGFLYTNKDSISLGLVFSPEEAARQGRKVQEIVQDFKLHPAVRSLIEGGETAEYSAHLIPEAGWRGVPAKLYREGLIVAGDAAGFAINGGFVVRGIDLAIASGIAAAQAVLSSKDAAGAGPAYMVELEKIGLIGTMKRFAGFPELLANPRMFAEYPALQRDIFKRVFTVDGKAPDKITDVVRQAIGSHGGISRLLKDAWKGWRSL